MAQELVEVQRPDRWDHPLDPSTSQSTIDLLLKLPPFSEMDERRFAKTATLADILRNDTRLLELDAGDVIFREGQYGGSAYLVLSGQVRIFLNRLLSNDSRRSDRRTGAKWLNLWNKRPDRRRVTRGARAVVAQSSPIKFSQRGEGRDARVFLQDVPGVLADHASSVVQSGELFGEMAAVTRSPREFTAVAENECVVLEIRWQGLKLLKQDPQFRTLLDERYRTEVLSTHLRETPLLRYVPEEHLAQVVAAVTFESFGNLEWYAEYRKQANRPAAVQIDKEPLIAEEGTYAVGLWIIRGGFRAAESTSRCWPPDVGLSRQRPTVWASRTLPQSQSIAQLDDFALSRIASSDRVRRCAVHSQTSCVRTRVAVHARGGLASADRCASLSVWPTCARRGTDRDR